MEIRWIRVRVRPMASPANPLGARTYGSTICGKSGEVLAALTGATLAADGLPGSLHSGGSDALSTRRQGARQGHRGGAVQDRARQVNTELTDA